MLNLPVSEETFKKSFLGGKGQLQIASDRDAWRELFDGGGPFDKTVDRIADLRFGVEEAEPLRLGGQGTMRIGFSGGLSAVHQIQLIWPGDAAEPSLRRGVEPGAGEVLVRLLMEGKGDASATGKAPAGPLSATFGLAAGGSVGYERLKTYPAATAAREILRELFAGARIPQQIDTPAEIPAPGEVLVTRFGGYLSVQSQVSDGYSITGTREIELGRLNLDLDYRLKIGAGAAASFRLAGNFEVEARAGSSRNFVRFTVRKSKESEFNFAADFGVDAAVHLKGMPDTSEEFLTKAFGVSGERLVQLFGKARTFTSVDELEKAAGRLAKGTVHELSQRLIGKALTDATVSEFVNSMLEVVETYNALDSRVIDVYEDYLDRLPELGTKLDILAKALSRDLLREVADTGAWQLVNRFSGGRVYEVLMDDATFTTFNKLVGQARQFIDSAAQQKIRDFVATTKKAFPLDALLTRLKDIKTPDQLKNLADDKLQGLTEQLLGKTFEDIRKSNLPKTLAELRSAIDKVAGFRDKYYRKAVEAANRSYSAQLHFAYGRASSSTALLDVEVDIAGENGPRLARLAAAGNFSELLAAYSAKDVRIHQGVLTHSAAASTQLQINLFGFELESMSRLLQESEEAIEVHDGGLMHVYTTRTMQEEKRRRGGELTASTFLFGTVARALQPERSREYLVRTLPRMSVQYDLLKEDDKTKPEELRRILELAELLDIVDADRFVEELRGEFPNGLGKVSARYVIRYDSEAVAAAFFIEDNAKRDRLRKLVADTMRGYISAKYTSMPPTHGMALLGFAYASPSAFELFNRLGPASFAAGSLSISLPKWFTGGAPSTVALQNVQKNSLATLYLLESKFTDRLIALDALVDGLRDGTAGVTASELNKRVKQFVEMADDLNFGRENCFFIVFDRLVLEGSGGRSPRNSALVLEITPPGGEKVTKVVTAARPAAFVAEPAAAPGARAAGAGD